MYITFRSKKLKKSCEDVEDVKEATKTWGPQVAEKLFQRIFEILAATTFEELSPHPPIRRHKLHGTLKNCYGLDLGPKIRMVLEPLDGENRPLILAEPNEVRKVRIIKVENYH